MPGGAVSPVLSQKKIERISLSFPCQRMRINRRSRHRSPRKSALDRLGLIYTVHDTTLWDFISSPPGYSEGFWFKFEAIGDSCSRNLRERRGKQFNESSLCIKHLRSDDTVHRTATVTHMLL